MIRRVFDDPNPFGPELQRKRKKEEEKPSSSGRPYKSRAIPPEERVKTRLNAVDAYTRHKMMINNYVAYYRGSTQKLQRDTTRDRNDFDIIRENHRFLWSDNELTEAEQSWEAQLAKKYYERLFKEYCIIDLSQYERNQYAMRWRTEKELFAGKGQFECGSKHCQAREGLSSWEVNFAYTEHGVRKNALVKVRLCPSCSDKLNFHSRKRLIKKELKRQIKGVKMEEKCEKMEKKKRRKRHGKKKEKPRSSSSSTSSSSTSGNEGEEGRQEGSEQKLSEEEKRKIDEQAATTSKAAAQSASEIWASKTAVQEAEKSVTDEFDEFIDDLLL